jgi:peptidyl-prolyl cis-trans isomerase SurA
MKLLFTVVFLFSVLTQSVSQTLFSFGKYSVSKEEFLKAFEKNNTAGNAANREKDTRNYLELYIRFKLKVQEAYDLKLDTLIGQQADMANFRKQIEEPFLIDDVEINRLAREAFNRSQKDIHLAHIFIPFRMDFINNPLVSLTLTSADSIQAHKRISEAYNKIRNGEDFGTVAVAFSADPSAAANKGDIGFITVFSLPYTLENVAYSLSQGVVSPPFISSAGYHIFKNLGERPAAGKMKVAQILIAYDISGAEADKTKAKKLADSLYRSILGGASFEKLAKKFSFDKQTNLGGGEMPPVGIAQYDILFENAVFGLKKDGEISVPFETGNEYHIVKRLQHIPVDKNFAESKMLWKIAVEKDKRANLARISFEKKAMVQTGMKKTNFNFQDLWRYTDTFLKGGIKITTETVNQNTVLLEFSKSNITISDWVKYAASSNTLHTTGEYPKTWDEFMNSSVRDYYQKHLETYSPEYRAQLKEFMEGNLLFEVMERKVWSKSAEDTAGLRNYYLQHKSRYTWEKSADAIVINTSDSLMAIKIRKQIAARPTAWKKITAATEGNLMADSGRIEWTQIPAKPAVIKAGLFTPVSVNEDRSASFTYVIKIYPYSTPRNFNDAKGLVMNDYQQEIEEKWIAELKTKYPVTVNEEVLHSILK